MDKINFSQLLENNEYVQLINSEIENIIKKRTYRPSPPEGFRWKRDAIDRMIEQKKLNLNFVLPQLLLIDIKKSMLPMQEREILKNIAFSAFVKFIKQNETKAVNA